MDEGLRFKSDDDLGDMCSETDCINEAMSSDNTGGGSETDCINEAMSSDNTGGGLVKDSGKHSSGDLHSRLKTRKLLGVGETDDGDVHRSKLSQILGHSDQLYIRLPSGLRVWQLLMAILFSIMALWALLFPIHYYTTMFEADGQMMTLPIRLYATALVCIATVYWSTVQAADRDVIRLVLLSSVVFFTLQTIVYLVYWLSSSSLRLTSLRRVMMLSYKLIGITVSSYFYWITLKDRKTKDVRYYR